MTRSQQIIHYYWGCVKKTGSNIDLTLSLLPHWWWMENIVYWQINKSLFTLWLCFAWCLLHNNCTTPLSEPERQLLVPYPTKANAFCELGRKKIGKNEPCSPQKAFGFVEYGTRSCLSGSDRGVVEIMMPATLLSYCMCERGNELINRLKKIEDFSKSLQRYFLKIR